jgi:hypothetical protein
MLRTRYGPALSLPTTDGHELEPRNNGNVSWSADEPYTTAFGVKSRSGGAATRHIYRSGSSSTGNQILFTTTGPVPNARHDGAGGSVSISGGSMVNDTTWHTLLTNVAPSFLRALPRWQPGCEQHGGEHRDQHRLEHLPVRLGLFDQPGLQRRHCADRVLRLLLDPHYGAAVARRSVRFPPPMERGARAHEQCATRHAPSIGTGVVTFLMG